MDKLTAIFFVVELAKLNVICYHKADHLEGAERGIKFSKYAKFRANENPDNETNKWITEYQQD